jgi:elongation factor G
MMKVEVVVPEEYMGSVTGDLHARRGRVESTESRLSSTIIQCKVPLSEMFGYSTDLRSMTQGRATYSMHFSHYEEAPKAVSEEVISKIRGKTSG